MKTLHIHIGTPKTATTAIQTFCMENEAVLESKSYCYPLFPYVYKKVAKGRNGHFLIGTIEDGSGNRRIEDEEKRFRDSMRKIRELFQTFDHVILSEEDIWRLMDDYRKGLWEKIEREAKEAGFQIHVIVYLRRQDKYFISNWNQNIKQKIGTFAESTFDEFLEKANKKTRLEYFEKLERVAKVVGKENITVRRFDKGEFEGGSIYADFLFAIGLKLTDEYVISQGVRNVGLYGNIHEFKRVLNGLPQLEDASNEKFIRELMLECSEISGEYYPCEMLSKEETEAFLENYKVGNQKIAEEYLHEPDGNLFDYTVKDVPKWQKENAFVYEDIIRFIGVMTTSLYEENQKLKSDIKELSDFAYRISHPLRSALHSGKRKKED